MLEGIGRLALMELAEQEAFDMLVAGDGWLLVG